MEAQNNTMHLKRYVPPDQFIQIIPGMVKTSQRVTLPSSDQYQEQLKCSLRRIERKAEKRQSQEHSNSTESNCKASM